ncbi:hypothetical protein C1645_816319 [Glomus cerebriforme]|uniref:Uncharacterized protein n=1 Tax=Glomus cerebriforme TaxID=658196 RepID=A0A397TBV2_9GLOM|nr:hypothetical protein C1645_816319 [Glomus cerebriforme]
MCAQQNIQISQEATNLFNKLENNLDKICELPFKNAKDLAIYIRIDTTIGIVTGNCILKLNVEKEAHQFQVNDQNIIDLVTNMIWNSHLTIPQRNQFMKLAENANKINQVHNQANLDTENRMSRLGEQQDYNGIFGGIGF